MKKKWVILCCLCVLAGMSFINRDFFINYRKSLYQQTRKEGEFVAFVRVKNEIKTILPCLESIYPAVDHIVIIHSNEKDDGTVDVMRKWCQKHLRCEIHEYPHFVIPANDPRLKNNPNPQNTLAAYYEFGLQFFRPEDWVVKIDADQIYFTPILKATLTTIKKKTATNDRFLFGTWGYNTFPRQGKLVKFKEKPNNGIELDHYVIKRKYISGYSQERYWEKLKSDTLTNYLFEQSHWFHFAKTYKKGYTQIAADDVPKDLTLPLSKKEIILYNLLVQPLLKRTNSPYQNLRIE